MGMPHGDKSIRANTTGLSPQTVNKPIELYSISLFYIPLSGNHTRRVKSNSIKANITRLEWCECE